MNASRITIPRNYDARCKAPDAKVQKHLRIDSGIETIPGTQTQDGKNLN